MAHQSRVALVWLSLASWGAAGEGPQIAGGLRAAAWLAAARTAAAAALPVARPQSWAALNAPSAQAGSLRAWACWALALLQQRHHGCQLLCWTAHDERIPSAQPSRWRCGRRVFDTQPFSLQAPSCSVTSHCSLSAPLSSRSGAGSSLLLQRPGGSAAHFPCHVGGTEVMQTWRPSLKSCWNHWGSAIGRPGTRHAALLQRWPTIRKGRLLSLRSHACSTWTCQSLLSSLMTEPSQM